MFKKLKSMLASFRTTASISGRDLDSNELFYLSRFSSIPEMIEVNTPHMYVRHIDFLQAIAPDAEYEVVWQKCSVYDSFYENDKTGKLLYPPESILRDFSFPNMVNNSICENLLKRLPRDKRKYLQQYMKGTTPSTALICIPEYNLMYSIHSNSIVIYSDGKQNELIQKMVLETRNHSVCFKERLHIPEPTFRMVRFDDGEFSSSKLTLPNNIITPDMLDKCYSVVSNETVSMNGLSFMNQLVPKIEHVKSFEENIPDIYPGKGLYILNGAPGTGKSKFLSQLLLELSAACPNRPVLYFPPQIVELLGSPAFTGFMLKNRGAIIIAEDAENAIRAQETRTQVISNVLNMTDGLMADALQITIVFTFNCDIKEIDPALLRPGRLKMRASFERLTSEQTMLAELAIKTAKFPHLVESPLAPALASTSTSLAELYEEINLQESNYASKS
jgi:hypothetical protein